MPLLVDFVGEDGPGACVAEPDLIRKIGVCDREGVTFYQPMAAVGIVQQDKTLRRAIPWRKVGEAGKIVTVDVFLCV